jgi:hypothetical protein
LRALALDMPSNRSYRISIASRGARKTLPATFSNGKSCRDTSARRIAGVRVKV